MSHLSRRLPILLFLTAIAAWLGPVQPGRAMDLTDGLMYAVPAPNGPPALDGTDNGWDLSAAEPMWVAPQTAKLMHAKVALNYDQNNLYVYARLSLPNRKLLNVNGPADPFWFGDMIELRVAADPSLPRPLDPRNQGDNNHIAHMSFWKDTVTGQTYLSIAYGNFKSKALNPPGAKVAVTEFDHDYVIQAVVPWSALNAPDGKNPFAPGSRMTAIWGLHWGASPDGQFAALYAQNPGAFAFLNWGSWGQIEFSPTGNLKPHHPTMEETLAALANAAPVGVPITVDVPDTGKLSVNIVGDHGEVIRDVAGGIDVTPGKKTVYWDGRDQWGFALPLGNYHWGAYFSHGLKARFVGFVGSSGNPPYAQQDGKGGWGGDHGVPSAVAADASGIYFGWSFAEAETAIVKIDYAGNTLWRKSPFIQGGSGDLHALASNGKYLFVSYDGLHPTLCRLDASTGLFAFMSDVDSKGGTVPIAPGQAIVPPPDSLSPRGGLNQDGTEPETIGLAVTDTEAFASVYSQNIIQVLDIATGKTTRTLACPRPRGLALDAKGNLYAVSFGTDQAPQIVRFNGVSGAAQPVITTGLVAPVDVAVDASGQITVTDEGSSQQIKTFSPDGKLVRTLGKPGGRTLAGTYDPDSYLYPCAIVADPQGGLDVAEAFIPKIFDRLDAASGKNLGRWFGWATYGYANIGDSDDPFTCYYPFEPAGFARGKSPGDGKTGYPDAYWDMEKAGVEGVGNMYTMLPYVQVLANGKKYFIDDGNPHSVSLIDGDNFLPVGNLDVYSPWAHRQPGVNPSTQPFSLSVWIDSNGDHKPQPEEIKTITTVEGKPFPNVATGACSMWLANNGDAYFVVATNRVLKIPSDGFAPNGAILWNPDKAAFVVPAVVPSLLDNYLGGRQGMPGLRTDSKGNIYTCLSTVVPVLTPELADKIRQMFPDLPQSQWCAYADADLAKHMQEGLGHTGESNVAKFAKYGPDGKMIWIAGRKATAAANPGEMYHFWAMAGIIDDNYVAGASEWGPIYFYTSDGYYVDMIMDDPAALPPPGPYTFGSETFSGRVQAFDKLGKVYAYQEGGIYAVDGFGSDMKVAGEQRLSGTVQLDKTYGGLNQAALAAGLQLVPISGDIAQDAAWTSIPSVTLTRAGGTLATAQLGYDNDNLYARVHVVDDTPLVNGADDINVLFKGGDVVGLDLGPGGDRRDPTLGDIRILAARIHGQDHLVAMKPHSQQTKQAQHYTTPAAGTKPFDFVGEVPGGKVTLTPDADGKGYTAWITVPRSFLEFPIEPGKNLKGDVEVLLSGTGQRGLQAVSRNWLNSGGHVETTMVDDIPTESWLYPTYWGDVTVK